MLLQSTNQLQRQFCGNSVNQNTKEQSLKNHLLNIEIYNTGYNFADEDSIIRTIENWANYTTSLHHLKNLMADTEYSERFDLQLDRAKRRLDLYEFYVGSSDEDAKRYYHTGIWSLVALFDPEEREKLLNSLKTGDNKNNVIQSQRVIDCINRFKFNRIL